MQSLVTLRNISYSTADGHDLLNDITLGFGRERTGLIGRNGAGKSTLLALIAGALKPVRGDIATCGTIGVLRQSVQPALGQCVSDLFGVRADPALRVVGSLSGGEMLRAGLACIIGGTQPPELLILDEPTNHLDIASTEAIERALNAFDGALLVVSHDADFLNAIGIERRIALRSQ